MTETIEGGVYATFTYVCHLCDTTVHVIDTVNQGHHCQPSPERFLALPPDPEDDEETFTAVHVDAGVPLESIADSLRRITVHLESGTRDTADDSTGWMVEEISDLQTAVLSKQALLDQVLEICKPSTSKLANAIRAVLEPPVVDQAPAEEPDPDPDTAGLIQPHPEAPVEEWREYARQPEFAAEVDGFDVDQLNRSQIRTMLGIAQPTPTAD